MLKFEKATYELAIYAGIKHDQFLFKCSYRFHFISVSFHFCADQTQPGPCLM